jgi:hypothetical protein
MNTNDYYEIKSRVFKRIASFLYVFLALFLVGICAFWFVLVYQSNSFLAFTNELQELFEGSFLTDKIATHFVSQKHFEGIKSGFWIYLSLFIVILSSFTWLIWSILKKYHFQNLYLRKVKNWFLLLLICWLIGKIILFYSLPLYVDEFFDFVFYTKNSVLTRHTYIFNDGVSWYNNHPLFADFSAFFLALGLPKSLSIRLPSILAELGLIYFLYNRFGDKKLLFLLLFLGINFSFWASIFSCEGRSYYLIGVLLILSFYLINDLKSGIYANKLLLLVLVSGLGLFLNKLYLMPFLGLSMYLFSTIRSKNELFLWSKIFFGIGLLAALFYFPSFFVSGFRAIYQNFPNQKGGLQLTPLLGEILSVITNINSKSYLLLLLLAGLCAFFWQKFTPDLRRWIFFLGFQFVSLALICLLINDYLPERTFIYFNLIFCVFCSFLVHEFYLLYKNKLLIYSYLAFIFANFCYNLNFSWLLQYKHFYMGKERVENVENCLNDIEKLKIKDLDLFEEEYFLVIYSKYYLEDKISLNYINQKPVSSTFISIKNLTDSNYQKTSYSKGETPIYLYRKK